MKKYWLAVVSKDHVQKGIEGNFAMLCHGKEKPLKSMNPGDFIIYYSPSEMYSILGGHKKPYQKFTACGVVGDDQPELHQLHKDFSGWRRTVHYFPIQEVPIKPLIPTLSFISNKKYWGMPFRRGIISLTKEDFKRIVETMKLAPANLAQALEGDHDTR